MNNLILSGIYNQKTLEATNELGVFNVEFDFRPKSFNFIQKYILEQFKTKFDLQTQVLLHFQGEPEFMVNDILSLFSDTAKKPVLVFSDIRSKAYYEQFDLPFYWHFVQDKSSSEILKARNCTGVVLNYARIKESLGSTNIRQYLSNLYTQYPELAQKSICLELNWDSNIAPSILEYLDYDYIKVSIDSNVEVCYRNVDSKKLTTNLGHISKLT